MTSSSVFEALGGIDSRFVEEALEEPPATRVPLRIVLRRCAAAAACLAVIVGLVALLPLVSEHFYDVTVTRLPMEAHPQYPFEECGFTSADMTLSAALSVSLSDSESDLSRSDYLLKKTDNDVFTGTVTQIETLDLDFDGEHRYVLLAHVRVQTVHRGGLQSGDAVTVLLTTTLYDKADPSPFAGYCPLAVGEQVLFGPEPLGDAQVLTVNGVSLSLCELATYSLAEPIVFEILTRSDDQ